MDAEVGVVGLGAAGSSALWRLSARGVDAIGFEQFGIGHSRGSSHGDSRLFRTALCEGPEYVGLVRRPRPCGGTLKRKVESTSSGSPEESQSACSPVQ
jgi:sarcosine oxidase